MCNEMPRSCLMRCCRCHQGMQRMCRPTLRCSHSGTGQQRRMRRSSWSRPRLLGPARGKSRPSHSKYVFLNQARVQTDSLCWDSSADADALVCPVFSPVQSMSKTCDQYVCFQCVHGSDCHEHQSQCAAECQERPCFNRVSGRDHKDWLKSISYAYMIAQSDGIEHVLPVAVL